MNAVDAALIFKSLGDSNRLEIIRQLTQGERCACQLLEDFDITQPTLSYHMKNLADCGLVQVRKEGRWSYYAINCDTLKALKTFVNGLICTQSESTGAESLGGSGLCER